MLLQRGVRDLAEVLERQDAELTETRARLDDRDAEVEKLRLFLAALKRKFGRSSEKHHPDQLTLSLEAIEEQIAALAAKSELPPPAGRPPLPRRSHLAGRSPAICHLPREERRTSLRAAPVRAVVASCM